MASQVSASLSAVPEMRTLMSGGKPDAISGSITWLRRMSIASSSAMPGAGRISKVTVRERSRCRISVGPAVSTMSASELAGMISPPEVTTGRLSIPWV